MTYAEQRLDPRWQKKRLEIMERDSFKCCSCDDGKKTLNVHHRYYVAGRMPWDYPDFALQTLCKDCHGEHHKDGEIQEWEKMANSIVGPDADGFCGISAIAVMMDVMHTHLKLSHGEIQTAMIDGLARLWIERSDEKMPLCGDPWLPAWIRPEQIQHP